MNTALQQSIDASKTDPKLIRLFGDMARLESDEDHAVSHEQFKRLDEIRDDMHDLKVRINERLAKMGLVSFYRVQHARR